MPGYRALSASVTGEAAEHAREAELLRRDGDLRSAVLLLESAIGAMREIDHDMPGWLCGRLAALYRTLGRHDDEVFLLEQFRESQSSEDARSRFDARLSKARTLAERKRRSESGALSSVREVMGSSRRRGGRARSGPAVAATIALAEVDALSLALAESVSPDQDERFSAVLVEITSAARMNGVPVERLVEALKTASARDTTPGLTDVRRGERYSTALLRLLAVYFDEVDR